MESKNIPLAVNLLAHVNTWMYFIGVIYMQDDFFLFKHQIDYITKSFHINPALPKFLFSIGF